MSKTKDKEPLESTETSELSSADKQGQSSSADYRSSETSIEATILVGQAKLQHQRLLPR